VAALRQTLDWGVEEIQDTLRGLTDLVADAATGLGLSVNPRQQRAGHLVGLRLGSHDPRAVAAALSEARVYVSVRGGSVRVSPHVFNDHRDVERLIAVLERALRSPAT
jgi:selenocysteine lyase/cysteine desulfurase